MDFRMGNPERPDSKHDPTRRAMGRACELGDEVDPASRTPYATLSSTRYCLARPGQGYLACQPAQGEPFTQSLKPGTYAVEWIDCATNARRAMTDVQVKPEPTGFTPAFRRAAVLCLEEEVRRYRPEQKW